MAENNPILFSEIFNSDGLDKLLSNLKELNSVYKNTMADIKAEAGGLIEQTKQLSGVTEKYRNTIQKYSATSQNLLATYKQTDQELKKVASEIERVNEVKKEEANINGLIAKSNTNVSNSYNQLEGHLQKYLNFIEEYRQKGDLTEVYEKNKNATNGFAETTTEAISRIGFLRNAIISVKESYNDGIISNEEYVKNLNYLQSELTKTENSFNSIKQAEGLLNEETKVLLDSQQNVSQVMQIANEAYATLPNNVKNYISILTELKSEQVQVRNEIKNLDNQFKNGSITLAEYTARKQRLSVVSDDLKDAVKRNTTQLNLERKIANEAATSYNRLSAQYSLNKIELNGMTDAERENTEYGRNLVQTTDQLYEEMKRLQAATGQNTLNVGNYSEATKGLSSTLQNNIRELAVLRMNGEENSATYQKLLKDTAQLNTTLRQSRAQVRNLSSDTHYLDTVMGGLAASGGGLAAVTGALTLFGNESKYVQEAQKNLQSVIAITTGLTAIQNNFQRQSALMLGISAIQTRALAKAEAYRRLVQIQGTKATVGATVAQRAYNLVANANPYVLLATAIITVVGALLAFSNGTKNAAEEQDKLNKQQEIWLDLLKREANDLNRYSDNRIKQLTDELELARARNDSTQNIRKIEDDLFRERTRNHNRLVGFYADEINNLNENRSAVRQLEDEIFKLRNGLGASSEQTYVRLGLDANLTKADVDDAIYAIQNRINTVNRSVEIAVDLQETSRQLEQEREKLRIQREKEEQDAIKRELEFVRRAQDERLKLVQNEQDRERQQIIYNYDRQIEDLRKQINEDKNITVAGRAAIWDIIISLEQTKQNELIKVRQNFSARLRDLVRESQDVELLLLEDGFEKQSQETKYNYDRQIEDLRTRLRNERGLTEQEQQEINSMILNLTKLRDRELTNIDNEYAIERLNKERERIQQQLNLVREGSQEELNLRLELLKKEQEIEIKENELLTADKRKSDVEINRYYNELIRREREQSQYDLNLYLFDVDQALAQSEFDLLKRTETEKTKYRLQAERDRIKKVIELNKGLTNGLSDQEIQILQNQVAKLDQEISKLNLGRGKTDIYSILGLRLDEQQKQAITDTTNFALDQLNQYLAKRVEVADKNVDKAKQETDARRENLEKQLEYERQGLANSRDTALKELQDAEKRQKKAIRDQQEAQQAQARIQSIMQAGDLLTASAKIWGQLGFPAAIPALGVMWGSFAFSKIKSRQLTRNSENYGDGMLEFVKGGSHRSGNDVDFGIKSDGTRRRIEGGESVAVINKRNTRKYRKNNILYDVINSLNNGTFEQIYSKVFDSENMTISIMNNNPELKKIENDVSDIKNKKIIYKSENKRIEIFKNVKRTINE